MARHGEILEVQTESGKKRFRIVELPVDPPNTIRRILVPYDTDDDDVPVGARMLDERETEGHLARSARPDNILVGDLVRRASAPGELADATKGTVEAKLNKGRFRVRFEDGVVDRFEAKDLAKVW